MPFQMKIQPIDAKSAIKGDPTKHGAKSRLKRLFERQFPKLACAGDGKDKEKEDGGELEPSSVCLDNLVVNFMEDSNDKTSSKCCNCFNGNCDESSDDEFSVDTPAISVGDASEILKGLVPCESVAERNLLADTSKIIETNRTKIGKGKNNCIKIVTESLQSLGYDVSICKSKWEKTPSIPAGEYEYIDVIIEGNRYVVDVDFRSEFEIARSTKTYRAVLQSLPLMFVGKPDRIHRIVAVVSEAARQSLKKKGLHFPPWRKLDYMKAKWLAPFERLMKDAVVKSEEVKGPGEEGPESGGDTEGAPVAISAVNSHGEFEMRGVVPESEEEGKITVVVSPWTPPAVKPKRSTPGARIVTGLASVLKESSPSTSKF